MAVGHLWRMNWAKWFDWLGTRPEALLRYSGFRRHNPKVIGSSYSSVLRQNLRASNLKHPLLEASQGTQQGMVTPSTDGQFAPWMMTEVELTRTELLSMSIESQSKIIVEQLLADLRANRREKLSLDDVCRAVEGRVDGIGYDLAAIGLLAYLTFGRVLEGFGSVRARPS